MAAMLAFIRQNARWIAGGFLLTYFSSFGQTFFIAASAAEWQAQFGLTHGGFGFLYMLATLASALSFPWVGRIVDVIPEQRVIAIVVPLLAVATVLAAFAPNVLLLAFAIFLLRLLGQGMMTHIALTATGRWFVAERGRAISLIVLGHQGGEGTLPIVFSTLAVAHGYRAGWLVGGLGLLLVALPFGMWAYATPRVPRTPTISAASSAPPAHGGRDWTRPEVLSDPVFWILLAGVLAPAFIGTTIFFHQDYLTALRAWPPQFYAQSLTLMAAVTVVVSLIFGAVIDRYGSLAVLPFFLMPLAAASFVLAVDGPQMLLLVVMTLLGISYGMSSTLFGALWPEIYGTAHLGAIRSIIVSAMVLATAIGPGVTGVLIDRGVDLPIQMAGLGAYCVVASAAMTAASFVLQRRSRLSH